MNVLDALGGKRYNVVSLTDAINALPYKPGKIGSMGLFETKPVNTTTVEIESKGGVLSLLTSSQRGSAGTAKTASKRKVRSFVVPHFEHHSEILADSVQNIKAFGETSLLETLDSKVNEELGEHKDNHDVTHEYLMAGATAGIIKDGDGSTVLYNLFTEFGITRSAVDFDFDGTPTPKADAMAVRRLMETGLGNQTFSGITAICGDSFFDSLVSNSEVKAAYDRWLDGQFLREDQRLTGGFEYAGIFWFNYRGQIGDVPFVPTGECNFIPTGVPGLFKRYNAPADYSETVNTLGQPYYAKRERMKFDKGFELESQSNPLFICTRPQVLVQGTIT